MIGKFLEGWRIHKRISALEAERAVSPRPRRLAIDEELIPLMARAIAPAGAPVLPLPRLWKRERQP
jgi:hypothetical protein